MSIEACAQLVERGDPTRFQSAMTAPPEQRAALFVLYAFNLEIARAPWVTEEAMIAEMRLQFWRDVIEEATEGGIARAHEVASPLVELIRSADLNADVLDQMVTARQWDIYRDAHADEAAFDKYIDATSGHLMWCAAKALGTAADQEQGVRDFAYGAGVANYLVAVPILAERGRIPLIDGRDSGVKALAERALSRLENGSIKAGLGAAALRAGWQTRVLLKQAISQPNRVAQGTLGTSEFRRKSALLVKTMLGRW